MKPLLLPLSTSTRVFVVDSMASHQKQYSEYKIVFFPSSNLSCPQTFSLPNTYLNISPISPSSLHNEEADMLFVERLD